MNGQLSKFNSTLDVLVNRVDALEERQVGIEDKLSTGVAMAGTSSIQHTPMSSSSESAPQKRKRQTPIALQVSWTSVNNCL